MDLKKAFPPMPEDCKNALMQAARSVKEEEKMKRTVFRTGLTIALVLVLTMTAALAASHLGLMDLIKRSSDTALPEAAQKILEESPKKTYEAGPLTLTLLETPWEWRCGEEMMDEIYNEQGEMLLIDMIQTDPSLVPPVIKGVFCAMVYELDPDTGERMEGKKWVLEDPVEIPVQSTLSRKEYQFEKGSAMDGFVLESAMAEQTCAGVYFTLIWRSKGELDQNRLHAFYNALSLQNEHSNRFPEGVNFSDTLDASAWPTVIYGKMLGMDALPETLVIHNEQTNEQIILK